MSTNPKVSVIVPIYKVQDFIEHCVTTLFEQTLENIEYIFVDDCTPDDSVKILENVLLRYPNRKDAVRIVHHEQNRGLPAARNTGLELAHGDYIFHCDSDDYVEYDMLESMVVAAEENNADLVWCDWYLTFEKKERYMKEPEATSQEDVIKNVLSGVMKYNVWNKIIRRSIYHEQHVKFPEGYGMGEDMTMIRLLPHIHTVKYLPRALYHYVRTNVEAFTHKISDKHLAALKYNIELTAEYLNTFCNNKYNLEIQYFLQNVKLPFLISDDQTNYNIWQELFPDSNTFIWSNKKMSLRTRILQLCAMRQQYWILKLYYIINRVLYKIVYR